MGQDTRVILNSNGSVLFIGPDSQEGLFTPVSGGGYTSPSTMNKTLTHNSDGTWTVFDLPSRQMLKFNSSGRLTSVMDRNGNSTKFTYNGADVSAMQTPAGVSSGEGLEFTFTSGRLTMVTHNRGAHLFGYTSYAYDSSGRLSTIQQLGQTVATMKWSSAGDLVSITDADGRVTSFVYDSSHRVISVSQGKGTDQMVTRFAYVSTTQTDVADPNTNQSGAVTAVPHTVYAVNSSTKLVSKATDPLGDSESATYTPFNDVASATNAAGGTTTNTYGQNSGHSVTQSTLPTGASGKWSYGTGTSAYNPTGATDAQGNSSVMTYDGAGNPSSTTAAGGAKASVTYNTDGTIATSTDPAGHKTTYTEDPNSKYITKITPPTGSGLGVTTISGVPTDSVTNGAGQTTNYSYDDHFDLTESSTTDLDVQDTYDATYLLTQRADNTQKVTYGYDNRGNLASITATPVAAGAPAASTVTYTYDLRVIVKSCGSRGLRGLLIAS